MKKHICMIISFVILCAMITVSLSEEISYQWAYQGEVAFFEENEKIGLIDRNGNILHCADLDSVKPFDNNGLSEITKNGKIGMINTMERLLLSLFFAVIWDTLQLKTALQNYMMKQLHIKICNSNGDFIHWKVI